MDKFLIIDGNNIAFRSFYALPNLQNSRKEKTSVLFGFCNVLIKTIQELKPKYIAVAFDKGKNTFRHRMYSEYKAKRQATPPDLIEQMPKLKELLNTIGIKTIEEDEIEADDIIGILAKSFNTENYILSADKDILQLISKNTTVICPKKGVSESVLYTPEKLNEEMGIIPSQIIELKALMGDSSDNIPGVAGVGEKTALTLLNDYKTLDGVYNNIENIKGKLREKLEENKEMAYLSKTLATIKTDYNLQVSLENFNYNFPFNEAVFNKFQHYELNSLLKRKELFNFNTKDFLKPKEPINKETKITELKTIDEIKNVINSITLKTNPIAIYLKDNKITFATNNEEEFLIIFSYDLLNGGLDINKVMNLFTKIFNGNNELILYDTKQFMHKLNKYSIDLTTSFYDISIARYLISSGVKTTTDLESIIKEYNLNPNLSACNLIYLKTIFEKEIKDLNLEKIYNEIEIPLVKVLYEMEVNGFKIDKDFLIELNKQYETNIEQLKNEIIELAGIDFNVNSPKQLSEVLFDKLKLFSYNNKKHSTNALILNDMIGQHPIIEKLIKYRHMQKLFSTYINAFLDLLDNENKIHTIFNQTLTATGRLSSSEPNLQNIPVKTTEGKIFRKIFISSFNNGKIVSADYNQIELRLLAAFSNDEKLIEAYNNNEDIHTRTASSIFNIPYELVTEEYRKRAKAVNFGIVYGISDFGLSKNTKTSRMEAKDFIDKYYLQYPKIKTYMSDCIEYAKKNKHVKTYFGRIRNIPELFDPKKAVQSFGERAAMNMPLQGTASDIIKLAMINVSKKIKENNLKSKLILTIHDELIVDTHPDEIEQVKHILKSEMEKIVNLSVKLVVDVAVGDSWYNV